MIDHISPDQPVLIAGPTASGKSGLALAIATRQGGTIVNADALQVFECWQVLSARPDDADLSLATHALYGHVAYETLYSTGQWLRDLKPVLTQDRPIIVGGTGLNFKALTEGLAEIPPTPPDIRNQAEAMAHDDLIAALDDRTIGNIDVANRARIQRAWEVLKTTDKPIWAWHEATPAPLIPLQDAYPIVLDAPRDWLNPRIEKRFDRMIQNGALDEVERIKNRWNPALPASKAIGAPEIMAYLNGEITLDDAKDRATTATRQYAKRQRTWFRARMRDWHHVPAATV